MDKPTYEELEAENTRLKGRMAVHDEAGSAAPKVRVWPRVGRGVLILLGCLSLLAVDLGLWANRNLISTDGYVAAVAPLAKDPAVQTAVVKATEQQIDANTDISATVQNALPDKAAFLAGPITTGVNNAIHSFLAKAVDSPKFADAWTTVNDRAHSRIINYVSKYEGNGQITVADAYSSLSDRLAGTKLGTVVANKPLPPKLGNIQLIDASWLPIAHTAAVAVQWSVPVGILIAIISFGAAIWWSPRRRKTLIAVALALAFTLGLANIIVRLIQQVRENNITDPTYRAAAHSVSQAVLGPFIVQTRVWIVVALVVAVAAWLSGPALSAVRLRDWFGRRTSSLARASGYLGAGTPAIAWLRRRRRVVEWSLVALAIVVLMFLTPLTIAVVAWAAVVVIFLIVVVEILTSTPATESRRVA